MISQDMIEAIEHLINNGDPRPDTDIEQDMKRAMRDLRARQIIHGDDRMLKGSYDVLRRSHSFFKAHFGSEGYELRFDDRAQYVVLMPGEIGASNRRQQLKRDETLVLLLLRALWYEQARAGELDEQARVQLDSETLMDRATILAGNDFPAYTRLKEILTGLKRRGLVRFTDEQEDREEQLLGFDISPAITEIVDDRFAADVVAYLEERRAGEIDDDLDVMTYVEERQAAAAAEAEAARAASSTEDQDDDNLGTEDQGGLF